MKKLEELGVSPAPWETSYKDYNDGRVWFVEAHDGAGITDFDCNEEQFGFEEGFANAHLVAAAPKLYSKAYEVAENLLVHLAMPSQTISMNRVEVAAMVKDLQSALAEAAGESEASK